AGVVEAAPPVDVAVAAAASSVPPPIVLSTVLVTVSFARRRKPPCAAAGIVAAHDRTSAMATPRVAIIIPFIWIHACEIVSVTPDPTQLDPAILPPPFGRVVVRDRPGRAEALTLEPRRIHSEILDQHPPHRGGPLLRQRLVRGRVTDAVG